MEKPQEPVREIVGRFTSPLWNYKGELLTHQQASMKYEHDRAEYWKFITQHCKNERDFMFKWLEEIFLREGARADSMRWQTIAKDIFKGMGDDADTKKGRTRFHTFRLDTPEVRTYFESLSPEAFVEIYTQIVRRWCVQM